MRESTWRNSPIHTSSRHSAISLEVNQGRIQIFLGGGGGAKEREAQSPTELETSHAKSLTDEVQDPLLKGS